MEILLVYLCQIVLYTVFAGSYSAGSCGKQRFRMLRDQSNKSSIVVLGLGFTIRKQVQFIGGPSLAPQIRVQISRFGISLPTSFSRHIVSCPSSSVLPQFATLAKTSSISSYRIIDSLGAASLLPLTNVRFPSLGSLGVSATSNLRNLAIAVET